MTSLLSLMALLSESYLQHLEHKAMTEALTIQIQPKTFKRYRYPCFTSTRK